MSEAIETPAVAAGDMLPGGYALTYLPALGSVRRNPDFWSDAQVRALVVSTHRQMTIHEALARIKDAVGIARTPSKSALGRVWKRLDKALSIARVAPVREAR